MCDTTLPQRVRGVQSTLHHEAIQGKVTPGRHSQKSARYITAKETYRNAKEPQITAKMRYIIAREPCITARHSQKSARYSIDWIITL